MDDRGYIHHLDEKAIAGLDEEYRKTLRPITDSEAKSLTAMPPHLRNASLDELRRERNRRKKERQQR